MLGGRSSEVQVLYRPPSNIIISNLQEHHPRPKGGCAQIVPKSKNIRKGSGFGDQVTYAPHLMYFQRSLSCPRTANWVNPYPPKSHKLPRGSTHDTASVLAPGTFEGSAIPFVP
jgi:hypothetical protein